MPPLFGMLPQARNHPQSDYQMANVMAGIPALFLVLMQESPILADKPKRKNHRDLSDHTAVWGDGKPAAGATRTAAAAALHTGRGSSERLLQCRSSCARYSMSSGSRSLPKSRRSARIRTIIAGIPKTWSRGCRTFCRTSGSRSVMMKWNSCCSPRSFMITATQGKRTDAYLLSRGMISVTRSTRHLRRSGISVES